ncbi:DNA repair and recombination protein RadB [Candidatus Pacearchaeota archaeon]|nr:DNA repair and recombination protein RadB [Candidatus Pacearchaeota archaeon]
MEKNKISAGSYDLNKWLFGGYEKDIITMIAGPAGSGKTNFCVIAAASQAKKENKVIFIDTEGGFSIERIKQLVGEETEKILKNMLLLKPTSFEEQKKDFLKLLQNIKKGEVGLIIVDGMTMLYRLELGDASQLKDESKIKEVNREMANQMKTLAEIARRQNIPVLITNQVYTEFLSEQELRKGVEKKVNLVGGDLLKYWSKCIIELKQEGSKRKAILLKHRSLPQKELIFEITNKGIRKRGWI